MHLSCLACLSVVCITPVLNVVVSAGHVPKGSEHSSLFLHGLYQGTQQSAKMHPLQGLGREPESLQSLPEMSGIWPFATDNGLP